MIHRNPSAGPLDLQSFSTVAMQKELLCDI